MKKTILSMLLAVVTVGASAQVFYNEEKLGNSRIQGNKVGNIAGAYLTFGLSSAKSNKVVEGETSGLDIKDKRPVFTILFYESAKDSVFMDKDNMDKIVLVKMHEKKNSRLIRTGKYGLAAGVQTGLLAEDIIPVSIDDSEDEKYTYSIKPKSELKKGEYGFIYVPNGKPVSKVYDFTIK